MRRGRAFLSSLKSKVCGASCLPPIPSLHKALDSALSWQRQEMVNAGMTFLFPLLEGPESFRCTRGILRLLKRVAALRAPAPPGLHSTLPCSSPEASRGPWGVPSPPTAGFQHTCWFRCFAPRIHP